MGFKSQLHAMVAKNFLLHKRSLRGFIVEFIFPVGCAAFLFLIFWAFNSVFAKDDSVVVDFPEFPIPSFSDSGTVSVACNPIFTGGIPCRLGVVPDTDEVQDYTNRLFKHYEKIDPSLARANISIEFYESLDSLRNASSQDGTNMVAGLVFSGSSWQNHTILMNSSLLPSARAQPTTPMSLNSMVETNASFFATVGWLGLESALDEFALMNSINKSYNQSIFVEFSRILPDGKGNMLDSFTPIFGTLFSEIEVWVGVPFLVMSMSILISERKSKMKEFLFILGLRKPAYYIGWLIAFIIPALVAIICSFVPLLYGMSSTPVVFIRLACYIILYYCSISALAFFIASFAKSTIIAIAIAVIALFVSVNCFTLVPNTSILPHFLCLMSPYAFCAMLFKDFISCFTPNALAFSDVFSWPFLFIILALDTFIYGFFAWYISQIHATDFGVSKPWYFLFTRAYWCGGRKRKPKRNDDSDDVNSRLLGSEEDSEESHQSSELFEKQEFSEGNGTELVNLVKSFKTSTGGMVNAVRGVSAQFCHGKITALLGHNGAGKTTTINMMIGMYAPNSGDAFVDGISIVHDLDTIRRSLGICPQHSLLYDELTAPEHLRLVGRLKGIPDNTLDTLIPQALDNMSLSQNEHRDMPVKSFSGGMKRKLSLAIALFGNPKVVFLDEPTTGVDIVSRRAIWDSLRRYKGNTSIVLTTHSMEEADALSDYIYIMANGSLCCGGTSMFLKQRLGEGYVVTFDRAEGTSCDPKAVLSVFKEYSPDSVITASSRSTFSISVPFTYSKNVGRILQELETKQKELGFDGFGVSLTTLEDVFIKASANDGHFLKSNATNVFSGESDESYNLTTTTTTTTPSRALSDSGIEKMNQDGDDHPCSPSGIGQQLKTMFWYNWLYARNNWKMMIGIMLLPALFALCFLVLQSLTADLIPVTSTTEVLHDITHYSSGIDIPYVAGSDISLEDLNTLFTAANVTSNITYSEYDSMDDLLNASYEEGNVQGGFVFNALRFNGSNPILNVTYLYNETLYDSLVNYSNLLHNAFMRVLSQDVNDTAYAWSSVLVKDVFDVSSSSSSSSVSYPFGVAFGLIIVAAVVAQRSVMERSNKFYSQLLVAGLNPFIAVVTNFVSMVLYTVPSAILVVLVGLLPFDSMSILLSEIIVPFILLVIIFIVNLALFNSVLSRLFSNPSSSVKWIVIFHMGLFVLLNIGVQIMSVLALTNDVYNTIAEVFDYLGTILIPGYGVNQGMSTVLGLPNTTTISDAFTYSDGKLKRNMLLSVACFGFYFILVVIIEFVSIHMKKSVNETLPVPFSEDPDVSAERARIERVDLGQAMKENTVVVRGVRKIFKSGLFRNKNPVYAVHNASFGIHENDCFGLLGPNGAGKSTLINMMTAELAATNGTITVNGRTVGGWKHTLYPKMCLGRCMQDDAVMGFLSPEQHIAIMSAIRCDYSKRSIKSDTDRALHDMELTSFANRAADTLSGGMCRKLSAALAMLPGTRLLVFDEPSTGMDPVTRRSLWNAITRQRNCAGRSVLLTTHSMEEAETLCGTLGIINRGLMQCFGNVQHLKARYSSGYRIMLEYTPESNIPACEEMLKSIVKMDAERNRSGTTTTTTTTTTSSTPDSKSSFDQAVATLAYEEPEPVKLVDKDGSRNTYAISRPKSLSLLFSTLEENCEKFHIASYAITQSTLEDVFMALVRESEPGQIALNIA